MFSVGDWTADRPVVMTLIISVLIQFCAGQSNSSTSNLLVHFFMDLAVCNPVLIGRDNSKPFPQNWEHEVIQNVSLC